VTGDHRAFLDATLPCLEVVWQAARHAAGDGQEPGDLAQETCLRACPGFAPLIAGAALATAPAFTVASSIGLRRFGTSGERGLPCPG
jgi:DNA-directed RNA polymerase specialized sigma24 family protein